MTSLVIDPTEHTIDMQFISLFFSTTRTIIPFQWWEHQDARSKQGNLGINPGKEREPCCKLSPWFGKKHSAHCAENSGAKFNSMLLFNTLSVSLLTIINHLLLLPITVILCRLQQQDTKQYNFFFLNLHSQEIGAQKPMKHQNFLSVIILNTENMLKINKWLFKSKGWWHHWDFQDSSGPKEM